MAHFLSYFLERMQKAEFKAINYDKVSEITQNADKNPATFLNHLKEAKVIYTSIDPASLEGSSFSPFPFYQLISTICSHKKTTKIRTESSVIPARTCTGCF